MFWKFCSHVHSVTLETEVIIFFWTSHKFRFIEYNFVLFCSRIVNQVICILPSSNISKFCWGLFKQFNGTYFYSPKPRKNKSVLIHIFQNQKCSSDLSNVIFSWGNIYLLDSKALSLLVLLSGSANSNSQGRRHPKISWG